MRHAFLFTVFFVGFLVCGCRYVKEDPFFEVEDSGLNWLDIHYFNYRKQPITRVKISMDGNGFVDIRAGKSALVANSFAVNTKDENWGDIQHTRVQLEREQVMQIFQALVDQGLFKKRYKWSNEIHTNEAIFAIANINNHTTGSQDDIFTTDENLAEHLKNVVLMFYQPSPKRRNRRP
ncbi:MAG: hypothetical protein IJR99_17485 [Kiritimatiellae bacterium]|nr:hypothetical protein [Kiritimatiellia bacterium]